MPVHSRPVAEPYFLGSGDSADTPVLTFPVNIGEYTVLSQTCTGGKKGENMELLWFVIIGIVAGWLAEQIMKGGGFGLVGDLVIGVIGALIGGFLFRMIGIHAYGLLGRLITATIGAIVLILLLRLFRRA